MTGRRLYDHHVDALLATERTRWEGGRYVRAYPSFTPPAWPFLARDERKTWDELAKRITPKPRKR